MTIETMIVLNKNGPVMINKSDYDPVIHKLPDDTPPMTGDTALRTDGPTVAEFVQAGYDPNNYPPGGYSSKSTPEEIEAAIKAHAETSAREPALVAQDGKRFFIVNSKGERLSGEGIDAKGYASNEAAWEAVNKLSS